MTILATIEKICKELPEAKTTQITTYITEETFHRILEVDIETELKTKLLRNILSQEYTNIFRTRKARELLIQIFSKIKSHITTTYAKERLLQFLPTTNKQTIEERQTYIETFIKSNKDIDIIRCKTLFKDATNIYYEERKKHNGVAIACADEEFYENYKRILGNKFYVTLIENERDLLAIDHYEHIRYISNQNHSLQTFAESMPQTTLFSAEDEIEKIAPELITDILNVNKDAIKAIYELNEIFSLKTKIPLIQCNENQKKTTTDIDLEIQKIASQLETYIQQTIAQGSFNGKNIMEIISKQQNIISVLDSTSQENIQFEKDSAYDQIKEILPIATPQLILEIDHLGKVQISEKELERAIKEIQNHKEERIREQNSKIAHDAKPLITNLPKIVEEIYELDLMTGIMTFIQEHELEKPSLQIKGISFMFGRNLNIKNAIPIEYYIGEEYTTAILTGANSGGKTTLLELVGQIQLLTQMGVFVPAKKANVSIVDEIYYFSKNKGSLNAGAFETLLQQFANISKDESKKLILADEIESVTEPDVAAKIIKGIISHINKSPSNTMILVTHMGRELETLNIHARFDGIEAKGLDKDLNLVVDRNPIIGRIARSTPQLIIERLAKTQNDDFYKHIYELLC